MPSCNCKILPGQATFPSVIIRLWASGMLDSIAAFCAISLDYRGTGYVFQNPLGPASTLKVLLIFLANRINHMAQGEDLSHLDCYYEVSSFVFILSGIINHYT